MEQSKPTQPTTQSNDSAGLKNKKKLNMAITVACGLLVIFAVVFFIKGRSAKASQKSEIALAQVMQTDLTNHLDSTLYQQYASVASKGHAAGKTAALEIAIKLYADTAYEDCIEALDKAGKIDSKVVEAGRLSLMGDCHANLNRLDQALKCYDKAISAADKNPEIVPFILVKKANIYNAQANYADEAKAYNTIINDYPSYASNHDIQTLADRAEMAASVAE